MGWPEVAFLPPRELSSFLANERHDDERLFDLWHCWADRNTFDAVTFEPAVTFREPGPRRIQQGGAYDTWQGYLYRPVPGDCRLLLDHLLDVWCAGRGEAFDAVLNHLAGIVQHPRTHRPARARLGLRGFNSQLGYNVFTFIHEAIWGGDRQREGAYKTIFVDETRFIEKKFMDGFMAKNFTKGVIASNNEWFAPVSLHDRRHFVLDVSTHRHGDIPYFKRLARHITTEGGGEAFLDLLLRRPVDFDLLKHPPDLRSAAKADAAIRGANTIDRFIHGLLDTGDLPQDVDPFKPGTPAWHEGPVTVPRTALHEAYHRWCMMHHFGRRETQTSFGRRLAGPLAGLFVDARTRSIRQEKATGLPALYRVRKSQPIEFTGFYRVTGFTST